jgi:ABC-type multidrug transport system ATPase subunit
MEIVAAPLAIFLDEPTSGLDSTAALDVVQILSHLASLGLTIVSVIHQPRVEIYEQFDDVLMLGPGGKTSYFGPVKEAQRYFESLGFQFKPTANPADVIMDILSGKGEQNSAKKLTPSEITEIWKQKKLNDGPNNDNAEQQVPTGNDIESMKTFAKARGASYLTQIWYCHNRSLIQQSRGLSALVLEVFVGTLAGALMGVSALDLDEVYRGILSSPYERLSSAPDDWYLGLRMI